MNNSIARNFLSCKYGITYHNFVLLSSNDCSFENETIKKLLMEHKALSIAYEAQLLANNIPTFITKLSLCLNDYSNINFISSLHYGLKELYILGDESAFDEPINNLPSTLEILHIESIIFNQNLDNLPEGLKDLRIYTDSFTHSLSYLPNALEKLELKSFNLCCGSFLCFDNFKDNFMSLPNNIKSINIDGYYLQNFNQLEVQQKYPELNIEIQNFPTHNIIYKKQSSFIKYIVNSGRVILGFLIGYFAGIGILKTFLDDSPYIL